MAKKQNEEGFVLVRRYKEYATDQKYPRIRTDVETYNTLAKLAAESRQTMTDVLAAAVRYAVDHLVWAEED